MSDQTNEAILESATALWLAIFHCCRSSVVSTGMNAPEPDDELFRVLSGYLTQRFEFETKAKANQGQLSKQIRDALAR